MRWPYLLTNDEAELEFADPGGAVQFAEALLLNGKGPFVLHKLVGDHYKPVMILRPVEES
jgi:hypothetical protein